MEFGFEPVSDLLFRFYSALLRVLQLHDRLKHSERELLHSAPGLATRIR